MKKVIATQLFDFVNSDDYEFMWDEFVDFWLVTLSNLRLDP